MVKRNNHYEAAFEAYLRDCRVPYVAVDEAKRSLMAGEDSLKSLDFIVSPQENGDADNFGFSETGGWLIDVKGRRFPSGVKNKHYWKNWSTCDDVLSLCRWEDLFGGRFGGLLVFAFNIVGDRAPLPAAELYEFRDSLYAFVAIRLADYLAGARRISSKWDTVAVSAAEFRRLARPVSEFFGDVYSATDEHGYSQIVIQG